MAEGRPMGTNAGGQVVGKRKRPVADDRAATT
jgi:hypothetical protein